MKKSILFPLILLAVIAFTACHDTSSSSNDALIQYLLDENFNQSTTSWSYSASNIYGKNVYLVKVNPTDDVIKNQYYVNYVTNMNPNWYSSYSIRSLSGAEETGTESHEAVFKEFDFDTENYSFEGKNDFLVQNAYLLASAKYNPNSPALTRTSSSVEKTWEIDDTRKLYVNDEDNNFYQYDATLYAKTDDVYVWVVGEFSTPYITTGPNAQKGLVTKAMAETYASKMQEIKDYICNVEVPVPSKIAYYTKANEYSLYDMSAFSVTGTKINIVITDCDKDNSNSSTNGGTLGYCQILDLYTGDTELSPEVSNELKLPNIEYSNIGNYFYVDSYFTTQKQEQCISTLAHEFQHLLAFEYKYFQEKATSIFWESGWNEMLSMLTEDMMQEYLNISNDNSPIYRLPRFNKYYYLTGAMEYIGYDWDDSGTYDFGLAYANSYAFGAWLARNFGGTKLIHEMTNNEYVGMDCVKAAVKTCTGTDYTTCGLLKEFAKAMIYSDGSNGTSFNKSPATEYNYNGYEYPLKAIDLWHLDNMITKNENEFRKYDGPNYLAANEWIYIRPQGVSIHYLGTATANNIEIGFKSIAVGNPGITIMPGSDTDSNVKYYIMFK